MFVSGPWIAVLLLNRVDAKKALYQWADALSDLAVKLATGEIDGERHKLVAIGHSAGATALYVLF